MTSQMTAPAAPGPASGTRRHSLSRCFRYLAACCSLLALLQWISLRKCDFIPPLRCDVSKQEEILTSKRMQICSRSMSPKLSPPRVHHGPPPRAWQRVCAPISAKTCPRLKQRAQRWTLSSSWLSARRQVRPYGSHERCGRLVALPRLPADALWCLLTPVACS